MQNKNELIIINKKSLRSKLWWLLSWGVTVVPLILWGSTSFQLMLAGNTIGLQQKTIAFQQSTIDDQERVIHALLIPAKQQSTPMKFPSINQQPSDN